MNFEDITGKLSPFFQSNNFSIAESFKDYIRYVHEPINIVVAYDWRDKSISVIVEEGGKHVVELSDSTIREFFNDDIKLRNDGFFSETLLKFLNGKGNPLMNADLNTFSKLKEFSNRMSKKYTDNLSKKDNLK